MWNFHNGMLDAGQSLLRKLPQPLQRKIAKARFGSFLDTFNIWTDTNLNMYLMTWKFHYFKWCIFFPFSLSLIPFLVFSQQVGFVAFVATRGDSATANNLRARPVIRSHLLCYKRRLWSYDISPGIFLNKHVEYHIYCFILTVLRESRLRPNTRAVHLMHLPPIVRPQLLLLGVLRLKRWRCLK